MSNVDHKVDFRAYETLLAIAMREREKAGIDHLCIIRPRKIIETYIGRHFPGRGVLALVQHNDNDPPRVTLDPFALHVNSELWEEAGEGEPLACFMLLHELAHILMHRHPQYSFSMSEKSQMRYAADEESAEWQANIFAALFMAPPYLASGCDDPRSLCERFNFPSEFAGFWFEWRKRRPLRVVSNFCPECGHQPLVAIGGRMKCTNCGYASR